MDWEKLGKSIKVLQDYVEAATLLEQTRKVLSTHSDYDKDAEEMINKIDELLDRIKKHDL